MEKALYLLWMKFWGRSSLHLMLGRVDHWGPGPTNRKKHIHSHSLFPWTLNDRGIRSRKITRCSPALYGLHEELYNQGCWEACVYVASVPRLNKEICHQATVKLRKCRTVQVSYETVAVYNYGTVEVCKWPCVQVLMYGWSVFNWHIMFTNFTHWSNRRNYLRTIDDYDCFMVVHARKLSTGHEQYRNT